MTSTRLRRISALVRAPARIAAQSAADRHHRSADEMEFRIDESLCFRTLVRTDAAVLFSAVDASRSHLREWLPWLDANTTAGASLEFIQDQTAKATRQEAIPFGVFQSQELVGVVGYNWIDEQRGACGLGYWLAERHQRKGIATRCVAALV